MQSCVGTGVCPYVCFYAFSVHALCVHVNVCVYYSTYTCVCTCVYSLIVSVPLSLCMSVSVHMCTCLSPPPPAHAECHNVVSPFNAFAVHGYCTVEERDVCTAAVCSIKRCRSCNTIEKVHVVYDFPWLLCVIAGCVVLCVQTGTALSINAHPFPVCSQSLLLTLWLLASTTGFLCSLPSPVWFLGITHSCPDLKLLFNL